MYQQAASTTSPLPATTSPSFILNSWPMAS